MTTESEYLLIRNRITGQWISLFFGSYQECVSEKEHLLNGPITVGEMRIVSATEEYFLPIEQFGDGDYEY